MSPQALIFMHNSSPLPTLCEMLRKILVCCHVFYELLDMTEISAS